MARKKQTEDILVGLDIGTSKVAAAIGRIRADGTLEVIGFGSHPSRGLKKGVVVDIDSTVHAIQKAIDEAERMAGIAVESVHVGIAGSHVKSRNSNGMVAIRNREVTPEDIDRVIDSAKAVPISSDERLLHVLPQNFIIDGQAGIRQPVGMAGVRLEAQVHLITASLSAVQNIVKCVQRCNLEVGDVVLEQLASAEAVLSEDEKELGVCLVDIGGGTTDIAIFHQGAIHHTGVIDVAGDQVTNDIAYGLRTPAPAAEEIKKKYGACLPTLVNDEDIEVPSVGDRPARCISRKLLAEIIQPRYEELFQLIHTHHLQERGFANLVGAGVVLTGGTSRMPGAVELAEEVFNMPVRLGAPARLEGVSENLEAPEYATTVGLLRHAAANHRRNGGQSARRGLDLSQASNLLERMKRWFASSF
ncbi:cell division protein FtsA [Sulfurivirga sp.]|uniref:cell division protein FtsA n=1 Tax=Sulfurivirga sp. TaxID=2614236 RepID=UPI0025F4F46F|nr:cell division protein FtsA [Sulfurivirga sp.]